LFLFFPELVPNLQAQCLINNCITGFAGESFTLSLSGADSSSVPYAAVARYAHNHSQKLRLTLFFIKTQLHEKLYPCALSRNS
jgi:hypothetical protein